MIRVPHLETDITQSCQLSCVGCNHSVPLWRAHGPWSADVQQVAADLGHLAGIMHADRWGALGGEPLLHHRLVDILRVARDSGVADRTEVWTNGLLLQRQKPEFWRAFDILVLSVYEGKHDEASLAWIAAKCRDEGVELVVKDERAMRNFKTMLEPRPTGAPATAAKFAGCFFRAFSRVANYGHFFTCCCAPHLPMLVQGRQFGDDGVPIAGLTEEALAAYLSRTEPLGCCTVCAGRDTARPLEWREERDASRWLAASAGVAP
jgi:hypothetical protein